MTKDDSLIPLASEPRFTGLDVVYRVDTAGRLTYVNDGWEAFAEDNGTPELRGDAILGRRVAEFIEGAETQLIYRRLLERAAAGARFALPYRCDSATIRRRMILEIGAKSPDEIEFRSVMVFGAPRPNVRILDRQTPRSDTFLTICSWCNRGRVDNRWLEMERVVEELQLFEAPVPQLTHGMCPDCQRDISHDPRR